MKLIVQIPCLNEENTLPLVIKSIPKKIAGIDKIETLVIDDGSTDKTAAVAKKLGVDHIIHHSGNQGLAASFADGINEALKQSADIIVNTDADNQYPQADIPKLIKPILEGKAEIVIGNRQTDKIKHFSLLKRYFQKFGSSVVRRFSQTNVPDAVSGFRAYSKEAALHMNIVTDFSYVIETIIQARQKRLAIASVDIQTNAPTRESRLFTNSFQHIKRSTGAIIRVYTMFHPLKVFSAIGAFLFLLGLLVGGRFVYLYFTVGAAGHIQSLILSAIFLLVGFQIIVTGVLADLIAINRRLAEGSLRRIKGLELSNYQNITPPARKRTRKPKLKAKLRRSPLVNESIYARNLST